MATSLPTSAKDMRECSICLKDMLQKLPKLLECKHSFCTPCLSILAQAHAGTSGLKVSCPKCKHSTIIKSGKVSDLTDNFLLQEVKKALDDQTRCNYCFYCSMTNKETEAVGLCNTCCRFMCKTCSEKHRKIPNFAEHEIMLIMKEKRQEFCQKHNQVVVYVCSACCPKSLLCDVCLMLDDLCHGHEHLIDYTTALSREEEDLRSKLEQPCNADEVLAKVQDIMLKEMSPVQDTGAFIKKEIDTLVEKATTQIQESLHLKTLSLAVNEQNECRMEALKLLESDARQLEGIHKTKVVVTQAFEKFTKEKMKTEAACKTLCSDPNVLLKLSKIKQSLCLMLENKPQSVSCWPIKGIVSKLRATKKGRVMYVCNEDSVITEITPDGMKRGLQTEHDSRWRWDASVDIHNNYMYISCIMSDSHLYKCKLSTDFREPFPSFSKLKPMCTINGSALDICVCDANNIMLIQPEGDLHRYNESSGEVTDYKCPYGDHTIRLTSVKADGQPRFTSVKADGQPRFIATYVKKNTILLHDNKGNTIQTLSKNGSPFKQPMATTINAQGNILVADFETCKIGEMTMKGQFVQDVLTKNDGLGNPVSVTYSHPYLWVADLTEHGKCQLKCFL